MLIDAPEATRRLGIKPATLYAYVSRGLIRSAAKPGSKAHLYYATDVQRLKRDLRKGRRTGAPIASYDRYAPILDTSLCLIHEGRLFYRGRDAIELAATASLEEIAALLWQTPGDFSFASGTTPSGFAAWLADLPRDLTALERAIAIMVRMAAEDYGAHQDITSPAMLRAAQRLLLAMAGAVTGKPMRPGPVHEQLARIWRLNGTDADIVRQSLVLSADHELNPSTYVARCVASTGATLYSAIIAALSSFSGPRHGGHILRVEAMPAHRQLHQRHPLGILLQQLRGFLTMHSLVRVSFSACPSDRPKRYFYWGDRWDGSRMLWNNTRRAQSSARVHATSAHYHKASW